MPNPDHLIPLGIDISHYIQHPQAEARERLQLSSERFILITARHLEGRMGLPNLIHAIQNVRLDYPKVLKLITGKDYMRETLEALIREENLEDNVRLLGFLAKDDLPFCFSAADLFVLPTEWIEGFGLATIEALASGLPVVGTPVGATPELLNPIEPALITQDSSSDALANTLLYWLNHRDELRALSTRCREQVIQHYDSNKVAEALEQVFHNLAER